MLPDAYLNVAEALQKRFGFKTLLAATDAAELSATLAESEELTVFAPTDSAFSKIPSDSLSALVNDKEALTGVLLTHVTSGRVTAEQVIASESLSMLSEVTLPISTNENGAFIADSKIIQTDIKTANGIIHVIDTVIPVPEQEQEQDQEIKQNTIIHVAAEAGIFNTLLAALSVADLTDVLQGEAEFTVLAPTDEAFEHVNVQFLLDNPEILRSVLLNHVIAGKKSLAELSEERFAASLQGEHLRFWSFYGHPFVDHSEIIQSDIAASNGTIHVINKVLIPAL